LLLSRHGLENEILLVVVVPLVVAVCYQVNGDNSRAEEILDRE